MSDDGHDRSRIVYMNQPIVLRVEGMVLGDSALRYWSDGTLIRCPGRLGASCNKLSDTQVHTKL